MAKSKATRKKERILQIHSDESLQRGRTLSTEEVAQFLESFRLLHSTTSSKTKLISLKVPEPLLTAFRLKAESLGLKYQTQIKSLMEEWLNENDN